MNKNTKADQSLAARKLSRLLDLLMGVDKNADLPLSTLSIFIHIARYPGCSGKEVADNLGLPLSTVSRNIAKLSEWEKHKVAGLNLIINDTDPMDRRRRVLTLTSKGRRTYGEMIKTMED